MVAMLAGIALGIGVLTAALSLLVGLLLAPRTEERPRLHAPLILILVLVLILFALTLPKAAPFSPGQRLGWGLLVGGVAGTAAALGCIQLAGRRRAYFPYSAAFASSTGVVGLALVLLVFRGDPLDALMGAALGFVLAAGALRLMSPAQADPSAPANALEAAAVLTVIVAAGCALAVHHFASTAQRGWWAFPLALAALWLLGQCAAYIACAQRRLANYPALLMVIAIALAAAFGPGISAQLAARLDPARALLPVLATGLVTGALVVWLGWVSANGGHMVAAMRGAALSAALVLFALLVAFKAMAGFGAAVALGAAFMAFGPAQGAARVAGPARLAAAIGAGFLLLRLLLEVRGLGLGQAEMSLHYALVGVVIGAGLPFLLSALYLRPGLTRALVVGALAAAAPAALLALWGTDAALGLVVGLVAAQGLNLLLAPLGAVKEFGAWAQPAALLGLGMGLVTVQLSRAYPYLYEMSRAGKAYLAGGIALAALLYIIAAALLALARRPSAGRGAATASPEPEAGP